MISRRDLLQLGAATVALPGVLAGAPSGLNRALARQKVTQEDLLRFEPLGQVTLLHFADIHAQIVPLYFREPSINVGFGAARACRLTSPAATFCASSGLRAAPPRPTP